MLENLPLEQIWRRTIIGRGCECWLWSGPCNAQGYGQVGAVKPDGNRTTYRVHRAVYEYLVGPIPDGLELDHLCHKPIACPGGRTCPHRKCLNPLHLEPVTRGENYKRGHHTDIREITRAYHRTITNCPRGHEYSESNTYMTPRGGRMCRECSRESVRLYRARLARAV